MGSARARPSPSPAWPSARPSTGRYKNLRPRRPTCQGRARRRSGRFGNRAGGLRLLAVLPGQELRRDQPQIRQGTFRKHLCKCKRAGDRDQDAPGGAGGVGARGAHPEAAQHPPAAALPGRDGGAAAGHRDVRGPLIFFPLPFSHFSLHHLNPIFKNSFCIFGIYSNIIILNRYLHISEYPFAFFCAYFAVIFACNCIWFAI